MGSLSFASFVSVVVLDCNVGVVGGFLVTGGAGVMVAFPHLTNILLSFTDAKKE